MPVEIAFVPEGVPPELLDDLVTRVSATGRPHVVVRPVTDTVKLLRDGVVGETVDRSTLWQLVGPAVLPEAVQVPDTLPELVAGLSDPVFVEASPQPAPRPPGT